MSILITFLGDCYQKNVIEYLCMCVHYNRYDKLLKAKVWHVPENNFYFSDNNFHCNILENVCKCKFTFFFVEWIPISVYDTTVYIRPIVRFRDGDGQLDNIAQHIYIYVHTHTYIHVRNDAYDDDETRGMHARAGTYVFVYVYV